MNHGKRKLGRIAFSAAIAAALGFGATEAFAGPTEAARAAPPACNPTDCNNYCLSMGSVSGECHWRLGCICTEPGE
jgi:hypothetical protein